MSQHHDTAEAHLSADHVTVIEPASGIRLVDFRELLAYRDLFYFMVWRDVKARYAQTVLGFAWAILRPVLTTLVLSGVFGYAAKIGSDGIPYPLFAYAATVPWTYFSSSLSTSSNSLVGNAMLSKVYFPRLVIPMTPVLSNLVDFVIAMVLVVPIIGFFHFSSGYDFHFTLTPGLATLPLLVLLMVLTASGLGMWLSSLAIQYRDVKFAISFMTSLLMYAAPVVWPVSLLPAEYRLLYGLYPMAGVIEGFRSALTGATPFPWDLLAMGSLSASAVWLSGALYFRFREHAFADVF